MKMNNKTYKTFLGYVYGEARKSEIKDINGNTKSFIFKNCRIIFGIIISVGLLILLVLIRCIKILMNINNI